MLFYAKNPQYILCVSIILATDELFYVCRLQICRLARNFRAFLIEKELKFIYSIFGFLIKTTPVPKTPLTKIEYPKTSRKLSPTNQAELARYLVKSFSRWLRVPAWKLLMGGTL